MKRALKFAIAGILLSVLLSRVDWAQIRQPLQQLEWWTLLPALVAMVGETFLSTWKWSRALAMHELSYAYWYLFRTVCTGSFLNNFLPTSIGGDAYRIYRTMPTDGYRSRAVSAIFIDRVLGILALLTLGAIGALWHLDIPIARAYLSIYALGCLGGAIGFALIFMGALRPLVNKIRHLKAVDAIEHNIGRLRQARSEWLTQVLLSLGFQTLSVSIVWILFYQTGEAVPFGLCALMVAAGGLAALLPLSINGIGLMEGSFVAMAVGLGVGYEHALLVALLRRSLMLLQTLIYGLAYLYEPDKTPLRESRAAGVEP